MGNCCCKDTLEELDIYGGQNHADAENTVLPESSVGTVASGDVSSTPFKFPTSAIIDKLVLETLSVVGCVVDK